MYINKTLVCLLMSFFSHEKLFIDFFFFLKYSTRKETSKLKRLGNFW